MSQSRRIVWYHVTSLFLATILSAPAFGGLVPAGDFQGRSLQDWSVAWMEWGIDTGLGGQTRSDMLDGAKFLPTNFTPGVEAFRSVSIYEGTPLIGPVFPVFGEKYDDGTEDNPTDLASFLDQIFQDTTVRVTLDGTIVLEGAASDFPDRKYGVTFFSSPIDYASPQPRGTVNAIAAVWTLGVGTIFDGLSIGLHTLKFEALSPQLGDVTTTYNIQVNAVPEPASMLCFGAGIFGLGFVGRKRLFRPKQIG